MPVGGHKTFRAVGLGRIAEAVGLAAAMPAAVPRKPFPVAFRSVFNQQRSAELARRLTPALEVCVEVAVNDGLEGKNLFFALLFRGRAQHQTDKRNGPAFTNPSGGLLREFAALKPVVGEIDPRHFFADGFFITCKVLGRNVVLLARQSARINPMVNFLFMRRRQDSLSKPREVGLGIRLVFSMSYRCQKECAKDKPGNHGEEPISRRLR